jgi:hypothetical protein
MEIRPNNENNRTAVAKKKGAKENSEGSKP